METKPKTNKNKDCEYDSFWDCHTNKDYCKKHFRITAGRPAKIPELIITNTENKK